MSDERKSGDLLNAISEDFRELGLLTVVAALVESLIKDGRLTWMAELLSLTGIFMVAVGYWVRSLSEPLGEDEI